MNYINVLCCMTSHSLPQANDVAFFTTFHGVLHLKDFCSKLASIAVHQVRAESIGQSIVRISAMIFKHFTYSLWICWYHKIDEFRTFQCRSWSVAHEHRSKTTVVWKKAPILIQLHYSIARQVQKSRCSTELCVAFAFPDIGKARAGNDQPY